jgi:hypothetical protein
MYSDLCLLQVRGHAIIPYSIIYVLIYQIGFFGFPLRRIYGGIENIAL